MTKVKNSIICLFCCLFISSITNAAAKNSSGNDPVEQGKQNYKILYAPPDPNKSSEQWLVYFGPTKGEAAKDKTAAGKRKYIEDSSPLKTIPTRREERPVSWIALDPDDQNVLDRTCGNSASGDRTQTSIYGY